MRLLNRVFSAVVPIAPLEHPVMFRIIAEGTHREKGPVVKIRTLPTSMAPTRVTVWVPVAEIEELITCRMAIEVTTLPCGRCGGTMAYIPDGEVNRVKQPFFACTQCEYCAEA